MIEIPNVKTIRKSQIGSDKVVIFLDSLSFDVYHDYLCYKLKDIDYWKVENLNKSLVFHVLQAKIKVF